MVKKQCVREQTARPQRDTDRSTARRQAQITGESDGMKSGLYLIGERVRAQQQRRHNTGLTGMKQHTVCVPPRRVTEIDATLNTYEKKKVAGTESLNLPVEDHSG